MTKATPNLQYRDLSPFGQCIIDEYTRFQQQRATQEIGYRGYALEVYLRRPGAIHQREIFRDITLALGDIGDVIDTLNARAAVSGRPTHPGYETLGTCIDAYAPTAPMRDFAVKPQFRSR